MNNALSADIFRAYDIRGHASQQLSTAIYEALGKSIGTRHQRQGGNIVFLGFDGRLTSQAFALALRRGLMSTGAKVMHIGMVPTAVVYHAAACHAKASAVIVTASHNPGEDNGLKYHIVGATQTPEAIQSLYQQTLVQDWITATGSTQLIDYLPRYVDDITQKIKLARPLSVVIDTGHGAAGIVARELFTALGCKIDVLFESVDGHFPAHHPDPSVPDNMRDLQAAVIHTKADIGLAFDGDGDRLGVVAHDGRIVWPDELMLLFSQALLVKQPGAKIIYDVKSTQRLHPWIKKLGGQPILSKTGHSFLRLALESEKALLAGELSGHIFFQDRWYGFDDGLYAGARLLELLTQTQTSLATLIDNLPQAIATPELKIPIAEADKTAVMASIIAKAEQQYQALCLLDGLRIDFDAGFGLIRASNTTAFLTLRFEADTAEALTSIQQQMLALIPDNYVAKLEPTE